MAKQDVTVELFYAGAWHDVTFSDDVYARDPIEITRGRSDELSDTAPAAASFTLDNRDGAFNPRNPRSVLYGIARNLPVRVTVDGSVRFVGEASSWAPRRAVKGDAWTEVRASGPLRRLGQGADPLASSMHRYFTINLSPGLAYWPMAAPAPFGAGVGETSMVVSDITGASSPDLSWVTAELAPHLGDAFSSSGRAIYTHPRKRLQVSSTIAFDSIIRARPGSNTSGFTISSRHQSAGAADQFASVIGNWNSGAPTLTLSCDTGTLDTGSSTEAATAWDETAHYWRVRFTQNGANVDIDVYLDGTLIMSGSHATSTISGSFLPGLITANDADVVWGYVTLWNGSGNVPLSADLISAAQGWPGELAEDRFARLCDEEGISATIEGDVGESRAMGPQYPDTLVNQLREIEATDDGFVFDTRDELGLTFRTGRSLWNQSSALELNYDAFHVAPPTDPVVDDLNVRNDVTATSRTDAKARAVQESGPLNVEAPADDEKGVGRYTHQVDVNPEDDETLPSFAQWYLNKGTVDEMRWPAVTVDLDATPELAGDVAAVDIGDRITITNLPADMSPDEVSLIVVGSTETVGTHRRLVTFTCIPESPYHVGEVATTDYDRIGTDGSTVNTAFVAGTDTSLSVAVASGHALWSTTAVPYDIRISGVRLRVTAVSGASSPQTFTVARDPVNGVRKTIAAGERVNVFSPIYVGL